MSSNPMDQQLGHPAPPDDVPASPPAEVLEEIAEAYSTWERLRAHGRRLHFATDLFSGRLTVQVLDTGGRLVAVVPVRKVLDVAGGAALS